VQSKLDHPATNGQFNLPALKSLGELAKFSPVCLIDHRETLPLPITRLATKTVHLQSGDYSYLGGRRRPAHNREKEHSRPFSDLRRAEPQPISTRTPSNAAFESQVAAAILPGAVPGSDLLLRLV
jgi:hypothetical protein